MQIIMTWLKKLPNGLVLFGSQFVALVLNPRETIEDVRATYGSFTLTCSCGVNFCALNLKHLLDYHSTKEHKKLRIRSWTVPSIKHS